MGCSLSKKMLELQQQTHHWQLQQQTHQLQLQMLQLQQQTLHAIQVGAIEASGMAKCASLVTLTSCTSSQALNVGAGGSGGGGGGGGDGPGPASGPGGGQKGLRPPPAASSGSRPESADSEQADPGRLLPRPATSGSSASPPQAAGAGAAPSVAGSHLDAIPELSEEAEGAVDVAAVHIAGVGGDEAVLRADPDPDAATVSSMNRPITGDDLKAPADDAAPVADGVQVAIGSDGPPYAGGAGPAGSELASVGLQ